TNMKVSSEIELKSYLERLKSMDTEFAEQIMPLIDERNMKIKSGQSVKKLLDELFTLKESQRKVRSLIKIAAKARAAVALKPCIIDYAVNFGLREVEANGNRASLPMTILQHQFA